MASVKRVVVNCLYEGRGIRDTPLCTVGYSVKRPQKLVAWMMWAAIIDVAPSLPFYNSVWPMTTDPMRLLLMQVITWLLIPNSREMDKQANRGAYGGGLVWEEGGARFHPLGFMGFADEK
jgi:hypothetical protein